MNTETWPQFFARVWLRWVVFLFVLAEVGCVASALADEWTDIQKAAWYAYYDRSIVTSDGVRDCEDNALKALRYLHERGVYPLANICMRKGEPHVFLTVGDLAIDNSSPRPISREKVGCE